MVHGAPSELMNMKPRQFGYEEIGLSVWQSRYNGTVAMCTVSNSKMRKEADRALIVVYGGMSQCGYEAMGC